MTQSSRRPISLRALQCWPWAVALLVVVAAGPDFPRSAKTKPRCLEGIPARAYHFGRRSPSELAVSRRAVLLFRNDSDLPSERGKDVTTRLYDLDRPKLTIDHCSIAGVVLQLRSDGTWTLNLRADQNRRPESEKIGTYNPKLHIKRNKFVLRLRCLGNANRAPSAQEASTGRPVLALIEVPEFWVERGEPRFVRFQGRQQEIQEFFDHIDRVEIEFFYR